LMVPGRNGYITRTIRFTGRQKKNSDSSGVQQKQFEDSNVLRADRML